ncbi:hypothetical protein [Lyngbya confervoides]|uniref:Uncharacterized protein n=1 Tax=Lyngbya confervoides BDU141951 TaxID=1574623 RepID=A0ABD4T9P1_9CYAN|nr:hypothetical protein [Lyngbya confervoides]MCM1985267.1 hypothetical protein [Lyngbya confervoides BDU141951]
MKLTVPALSQLAAIAQGIFFRPMLYLALIGHWTLLQWPVPTDEVAESEALLEESVSITQAKTLKTLAPQSSPTQSGPTQADSPSPKLKPKPKRPPKAPPILQALRSPQVQPASPTPVAEPDPLPQETQPSSKQTDSPRPQPDPQGTPSPDLTEDRSSEDQEASAGNPVPDHLLAFADSSHLFGGSAAEQSVGFLPALLPEPERVFTAASIEAYNKQTGELEQQEKVLKVDWWKNKPQKVAIEQFRQRFQDHRIQEIGSYAGGPLYELEKNGQLIYASLIQPSKRTLRSSTVFVIWKNNPLS